MPTFLDALARKRKLEAAWEAASKALDIFPRNEIGLTPDHVKALPEYRAALSRYNTAFQELRKFNAQFCRQYKREMRAMRKR